MSHARTRRAATLSFVVVALLVATPAVARAQELSRATIALVRELPDSSATATIIRTSTRTLVLLRERDADAATVATVMASLYRSLERVVAGPDKKLVINLHGQRRLAALSPNERQFGERYLTELRGAAVETIDGIGAARVTSIPLQPQRKKTLR